MEVGVSLFQTAYQVLPAAVVGVSYSKPSIISSGTSKRPNTSNDYSRCAFTPNALLVLVVGQNVLVLPRTVVDVSYSKCPQFKVSLHKVQMSLVHRFLV